MYISSLILIWNVSIPPVSSTKAHLRDLADPEPTDFRALINAAAESITGEGAVIYNFTLGSVHRYLHAFEQANNKWGYVAAQRV